MICRVLKRDDLVAFRALHRTALAEAPHAFVESAAQDAARSDDEVTAILDRGETWGALQDGRLVAKLVIDVLPYQALAHTRWLHGVYVNPEARGSGAAAKLVDAAMQDARGRGVFRFVLWVNSENAAAKSFYEKLGFREIGRVPQGIAVGGTYADDVLMCHAHDPAPAPRLDASGLGA